MTTKGQESKDERPQVKVCGLTRPEEAAQCAELGADAIGCIFFPKSPRNVSVHQAGLIFSALPEETARVGVFVDASFSEIMLNKAQCGLTVAQLHGRESPSLVQELVDEGVTVVKAFFSGGIPSPANTRHYNASACLIECAGGPLPGGNALPWNWSEAASLDRDQPFILAGGLAPENICEAISACFPDAVDVSSGVESKPGRKDLQKVQRFIHSLHACSLYTQSVKKIF